MYAYIFLILSASHICLSDDSDNSLFPRLPLAPVTSENELCKADSVTFLENLDNLTLWSYQMWDASEKSTTGSLQGNRFHMGDWDECMKVKGPFRIRFCLVVVKAHINDTDSHHDPRALDRDPQGSVLKRILQSHDISQISRDSARIGWCVPASCTNEELNTVLDDHFNRTKTHLTKYNVTYSGVVVEKLCQTQGERKPFDVLDIVFCTILAMFLFIVIIATIYELKIGEELTEKEKQEYQKSLGHRILIGFSARNNFFSLTRADVSNPSLSSLYGLRTVSIVMIIMGHRFGTYTSGPLLNFDDIEIGYRTVAGSIIFHADLFVDTFFIISGILVTYGLMIQYKKKYVSPLHLILLRYMRLTPVYAFVIYYYVTVYNYMGTGPLWKAIAEQESEDCRNNWWTNLLYVNNYVNADHICMTQTWYLSCDYHYFIIAIFVVLLFSKNKMLGGLLFMLCFILSMAVPLIITVVYMRPALLLFFPDFTINPKSHQDFLLTYIKSHTRATPYCVGMMIGYVYYKMRGNEKSLSKLKSHTITLISILLLFVALASSLPFYNPYHEYNVLEAGFYAGFNRLTWSFGTMGLLLTASFGHTTVIQKVLSWSPFVPLSKLVYGAYLIHMSIQFRSLSMTWTPQRFDIVTLLCATLGDCFVAFIGALVLYLLIEIPTTKLFKELLIPPRHVTSQPASNSPLDTTSNNNYIQRESNSRL